MQAGFKTEGFAPISAGRKDRGREIAAEIARVQHSDPLGRRNLLESLVEHLPPKMGAAVRAALANIPANPGFGPEGRFANKAEEILLESIRFGFENHEDPARGMMWRLLRLGKENIDSYTNHPETLRGNALLGWRILNALHELAGGNRPSQVKDRWMRPAASQNLPQDITASKKNAEAIDAVFDMERAYEHRNHEPSHLGRVVAY